MTLKNWIRLQLEERLERERAYEDALFMAELAKKRALVNELLSQDPSSFEVSESRLRTLTGWPWI